MDGKIKYTDPLQKRVNAILDDGSNRLEVARRYAKKNCPSCRGDGVLTFLRRAGATEKEPRTVRICGCSRKRIIKEARKQIYGEA